MNKVKESWTLVICIVIAIVVTAWTLSGCATARAVVRVVEAVGQDVEGSFRGMKEAEENREYNR